MGSQEEFKHGDLNQNCEFSSNNTQVLEREKKKEEQHLVEAIQRRSCREIAKISAASMQLINCVALDSLVMNWKC